MLYLNNKGSGEMAQSTKAHIKAVIKYKKSKTKQFNLSLNTSTDRDIIEKLESVPSKQGYIKNLIREDIEKESQEE